MDSGNSTSAADKPLGVTLLADEWRSTKGGLSTLNRELAKQLAKLAVVPGIKVSLLVPECSEGDKEDACSQGVTLFQAEEMVGMPVVSLLSFPPRELHIDVVIGHGQKLGPPAQAIKKSHNCTWVHVVHTASEELAMFKNCGEAISKGEKKQDTEMQLCSKADLVVAIGPKLAEACRAPLRARKKDVFDLTPGIFQEFCNLVQAEEDLENFRVLVFGRGDSEDFELKGYDIAAQAVAELKDSTYRLIFVGAPKGKEEEVKNTLLKHGISRNLLIERSFLESREKLADLFLEADLAIMPSRTEGFGLTALEALSAGLPILVTGNSGFGHALKNVPFGQHFVVDSEDAKVWAKEIKQIREKERKGRLEESRSLRTSYAKLYDWQVQCKGLVEKMLSVNHVPPPVPGLVVPPAAAAFSPVPPSQVPPSQVPPSQVVPITSEKNAIDEIIWKLKITEFNQRLKQAKDGTQTSIYSSPFYTGSEQHEYKQHGYKMCLKIDLNGASIGKSKYVSVYMCLEKGDNDDELTWPFNKKVVATLIDQQEDQTKRKDIQDSIDPGRISKSITGTRCFFQKPTSHLERNRGFGFDTFISHDGLGALERCYLKDDTLLLHVIVKGA